MYRDCNQIVTLDYKSQITFQDGFEVTATTLDTLDFLLKSHIRSYGKSSCDRSILTGGTLLNLEVRRHRVDKTGTILVPVPVSIVELLKSQLTFGPEIVPRL